MTIPSRAARASSASPEVTTVLPTSLPRVERRAEIPAGFRAAGLAAGIKRSGRPDLALIVAERGPVPVAAIFTQNAMAAAPVRLSRANLHASAPDGAGRYGWASAIVSTSGSANAATGEAGEADQLRVGEMVAAALGAEPATVLHLSTGIIGIRLPLEKVEAGLSRAVDELAPEGAALERAAAALRTTDSTTKVASVSVGLPMPDGASLIVRVSGIAKGVGMIHPRMATMLSVVLTDAPAGPATLAAILRPAAARTWNQLSVDGDTSTNDTVFLVASGAALGGPATAAGAAAAGELGGASASVGVPAWHVEPGTPAFTVLASAVEAVARDLARQQAADGEGATCLLTCQVSGAADDADARAIARAVISSSLVKSAAHGKDPNWGRIAGAAGNATLPDPAVLAGAGLDEATAAVRAGARARLDPARLRIAIAGHLVFDGGAGGPVEFDRAAARAALDAEEILIRLDLGLGDGRGEAFGCDLTEEYVRENSEYTT